MALLDWASAITDGVDVVKSALRSAFANAVVAVRLNVAALRATDMQSALRVLVDGTFYYYDAADTTSADDGVFIIIDSAGRRYKKLATAAGGRELLTAPRTYYVRTDGSDSNSGLIDSAAGAFLTPQKGMDVIAGLDIGTQNVTLQIRSGTYNSAGAPVLEIKRPGGVGWLLIQGDVVTPANVVFSGTTPPGVIFADSGVHKTLVRGIKLTASGATVRSLRAINGAVVTIEDMDFGSNANSSTVNVESYGVIQISGNLKFTGNGVTGFQALGFGGVNAPAITAIHPFNASPATKTIDIPNAITFSTVFFDAQRNSAISLPAIAYTNGGNVTGKKYNITGNSNIHGAANIPGTIAGTTTPDQEVS